MADGTAVFSTFFRARSLFSNRNVAWLFIGQAISQIGEGLSKVALLWFVYDLTGSALKMTMIGILQTLPPLLFGPFAGALLDRVSKRTAMIMIDTARAALLALIPTLYWTDLLNLPSLYVLDVLVFATAMFSMAFGPALKAMEPLLAKATQLTQINALDQNTMTIGQLVGPAISGMLITTIGAQNVLYVNAGAFLLSASCKFPIQVKETRRSTGRSSPFQSALHEMAEGISIRPLQAPAHAAADGGGVIIHAGFDGICLSLASPGQGLSPCRFRRARLDVGIPQPGIVGRHGVDVQRLAARIVRAALVDRRGSFDWWRSHVWAHADDLVRPNRPV